MKKSRDLNELDNLEMCHTQLKEDILKRLYLNYQGTQSCAVNIDDKIILEFADKAKQEMQTTLRVIEEVIKTLQNQI